MKKMSSISSRTLVIEMVGRLPGPLATQMLVGHGIPVLKIETDVKRDPFSYEMENHLSPFFNNWYEVLKVGKTSIILNTDNYNNEIKNYIEDIISKYDNFILINSHKRCPYEEITHQILSVIKSQKKCFYKIQIWSDKNDTPLHDLDMCTKHELINSNQTSLLKYPVCGMLFASKIALKISLAKFSNQTEVIYFEDEMDKTFHLLPININPSPIEGTTVSYSLYTIKDGTISLSCMEKKSWLNFTSKIGLKFSSKDRFARKDSNVHKELSNRLKEIAIEELNSYIPKGELRCFTFLK